MASLLFNGPPKDEDGNPKKIPKVAVYVAGAAFAVTTGLTLLVLPFVRQAAKLTSTPQFMSNRNLIRLHDKPIPPKATSFISTSTSTSTKPIPPISETGSDTKRSKWFNDTEERSLYGSLEGEQEYVSPWLGAQALGLATALVFGSAGLGAWGIAKLLGVKDMGEFAGRMRDTLQIKMPGLTSAVRDPDPAIPKTHDQQEEESQLAEWAKVLDAKT